MQSKITKRSVDALRPTSGTSVLWDTEIPGLGVRCRGGAKHYLLKYRFGGRQRWATIGRHGAPWTPTQARKEALRLLGVIAAGRDPAEERDAIRRDPTVAELGDLFLSAGSQTKKKSTLATDRSNIERHIKPLLGRRKVRNVVPADVKRFMSDVAAGKTATDVKTGARGRAPVKGVKLFKRKKLVRFLSGEELARLGDALVVAEAEGVNSSAIFAIRLLALTGCRKSEVLSLRWEWVDFEHGCLRLPDSKTGAKVVPLGAPALKLLASLPRDEKNPHVFPGEKPEHHLVGLQKVWEKIRAKAKLPGVRIHDLRHSFASIAVADGNSLYLVGKVLGHQQTRTTEIYAHVNDDPVRGVADRTAQKISDAMALASPEALPSARPASK